MSLSEFLLFCFYNSILCVCLMLFFYKWRFQKASKDASPFHVQSGRNALRFKITRQHTSTWNLKVQNKKKRRKREKQQQKTTPTWGYYLTSRKYIAPVYKAPRNECATTPLDSVPPNIRNSASATETWCQRSHRQIGAKTHTKTRLLCRTIATDPQKERPLVYRTLRRLARAGFVGRCV